ncbi:MAG: DUF4091 domain-containing protein [Clostridia bacterium]|nr:DUF4091 domain-containing protein [Clostridia bacterium]
MVQKEFEVKVLSSLAKVFPDRIVGRPCRFGDVARGQEVSFQVAFRYFAPRYRQKYYRIEVKSPLREYITLYRVGNVPSDLSAYPERNDRNYISTHAGLFPDPLYPMEDDHVCAAMARWRAIWVSVDVSKNIPLGKYPVEIRFYGDDGSIVATCVYHIKVHTASLPAPTLLYTQWFHCDCIADAHGVKIFSEEHWHLIGEYMQLAAKHGMNMILTPILTPPLDTAIGGERPTVQLVEIEKQSEHYTFNFSRLARFVSIAKACGIENFEISHFFTQWGAAFCPKVVASKNGKQDRIFGWDTAADSREYQNFLQQLIPALLQAFSQMGIPKKQLWFHVSDEPKLEHLPQYRISKNILQPLITDCHHIDALSDYDFYRDGLVETPVVATDHIEPYLDAKADGIWCYYCCSQCVNVANRFFSMPSSRNRIIGVQIYKYGISGFLHWGYNFYYSQYSLRKLNPYEETDGGGAFPSGDAFSVYPYRDTVIPSLRQKVFSNALEDIRLLQLLETKIGKARVIEEIDAVAGKSITFSQYPTDERFFKKLYQRVFELLEYEKNFNKE